MKAPGSLETLVEYGIIQEVLRPLMSGKEAQVFVVLAGGDECVAKVYKEATRRTFKHRSVYTEGRRTRNTRDQRAMSKRSQHGRKKDEEAWRNTEVDMIFRLRDAGVRVPAPINFAEGVLVMELVKDADGQPAPRLGDLAFSPAEARTIHRELIREVVRMLCAGVIHGDLSEFNVLMTDTGPVVIDFPQAVDPTQNPNGKTLLLRDVANLDRFLARFAPDEPATFHGEEIWALFESNRLRPDTKLSGRFEKPEGKVDTAEVMALIEDADRENRMRRRHRAGEDDDEEGVGPSAPFRRVVDFSKERIEASGARAGAARKRRGRERGVRSAGDKLPGANARAAGDKLPGANARAASAPTRPRVPPSGPAAASPEREKREKASSGRRRRRPKAKAPRTTSEASDASFRRGRPSRAEGEAPAGSRVAKSAADREASEKPARGRDRRPRSRARRKAESADEAAPTKRRGESSSPSPRARPAGGGTTDTRPPRRRRRRSPGANSTR